MQGISIKNYIQQVGMKKPTVTPQVNVSDNSVSQQPNPADMKKYSDAIKAYSLATHSIDFENKTEKAIEKTLKDAVISKNADKLAELCDSLFPAVQPADKPLEHKISVEQNGASVVSQNFTFKALANGEINANALNFNILSPQNNEGKKVDLSEQLQISQNAQGATRNAIFAETTPGANPATVNAVTVLDKTGNGFLTVIGTKNKSEKTDIAPCIQFSLKNAQNNSLVVMPLNKSDIKANETFKVVDGNTNQESISLNHTKTLAIIPKGSDKAYLIRTIGEFDGKIKFESGENPVLKISGRSMPNGKDSQVLIKCDEVPLNMLSGGSVNVVDDKTTPEQLKAVADTIKNNEANLNKA